MQYQRAHPVTIFFNLTRVLYFIIIPVLRGFFSAVSGGFTVWLSGAWADILVFLAMIALATLGWLAVEFRYDDDHIEIRSGLFARRHTSIAWDKVITLSLLEPFYLRPLRAVRLRADTVGGSFKDADFTILLSKVRARALLRSRRQHVEEPLGKVYQPATLSIVALSILTSNSFAGIVFIATFISQSGKLLGESFSESLIATFEETARTLAFGIPPAAAAIAYALLAGWLIGFLLTFFRYKNFTLTRKENTLSIIGGLFTNREYYIHYSDINFIDIRQSIATKLLRLQSLYLSAVGYGKQKDDISCIIPAEAEGRFKESHNRIFPALAPSPRQYKPQPRGVMRFLSQPLFALFGIASAIWIFSRFFPEWSDFVWFVGLMAAVPAIAFLAIRWFEYATGGFSYSNDNYTIRYSLGLSLHTVIIPVEKVVRIELRQSFLQKFGPYCDLIISSKAEGHSFHCCRNLVKTDLMKLFNL